MNKTTFTGVKQYPIEYTEMDMIKYGMHVSLNREHFKDMDIGAIIHNDLFMSWLKEHKIEKWIEMTRNFKIEQILK